MKKTSPHRGPWFIYRLQTGSQLGWEQRRARLALRGETEQLDDPSNGNVLGIINNCGPYKI